MVLYLMSIKLSVDHWFDLDISRLTTVINLRRQTENLRIDKLEHRRY